MDMEKKKMKAIKERLDNRISRLHFHILSRILAIRHAHKNTQIGEKRLFGAVKRSSVGNAVLNQGAGKVRIVHSAGCKAAVLAQQSQEISRSKKINK